MKKRRSRHRFKQIPLAKSVCGSATHVDAFSTPGTRATREDSRQPEGCQNDSATQDSPLANQGTIEFELYHDEPFRAEDPLLESEEPGDTTLGYVERVLSGGHASMEFEGTHDKTFHTEDPPMELEETGDTTLGDDRVFSGGHPSMESEGTYEITIMEDSPLESEEWGDASLGDVQRVLSKGHPSINAHTRACTPNSAAVKLRSWQALWGLVMICGNRKMTKAHYQSMRTVADAFSRMGSAPWAEREQDYNVRELGRERITSLPHFTTVHRTIKPVVLNFLAPRGREFLVDMDVSKAGARPKHFSSQGNPQAAIRVILPSEYARSDMATGPVFDQICSTSLENARLSQPAASVSTSECVDVWPLVAARDWFYGPVQSITVDGMSSSHTHLAYAERGDVLRVALFGYHSLHDPLRALFSAHQAGEEYVQLQGTIGHIWTVHHRKRRGIPGFAHQNLMHLSPREKAIVNTFNFIPYTSPSDTVDVEIPDLPIDADESRDEEPPRGSIAKGKMPPDRLAALRRRRAALRERQRQIEMAWVDWSKPILKPGDIVTLLRPTSSPTVGDNSILGDSCQDSIPLSDYASHLCLVHRFWTENEEQPRFLFWIPPTLEISMTLGTGTELALAQYCHTFGPLDAEVHRDVYSVHLARPHSGKRGPGRFEPVSSTGTLPNGESYLIYRFLLFWDGFEVFQGKSASGEGFYMLCLNLPVQARSSASAVRVLSLTPLGVRPGAILERIQGDVITGMTEGYLDYDANGVKRRIFLDLVGIIGDTPALNGALDVLGHTATSFCHLCTLRRHSSTMIGSRYTRTGSHGLSTRFSRSFYAHTAVRDCNAQKETCRLLGMRPDLGTTLPIHSLSSEMLLSRHRIPRNSSGTPLIAGTLDPYKSCLVAPHHLLSGHARDCINLAFKLLPSREHRVLSEKFIIGFLKDCGLPEQNRLFDHDKKRLHSMTMTELYALAMVAEKGIRAGCANAARSARSTAPAHRRLASAIQLISSCANLIAELWYMPNEYRDGQREVTAFNDKKGLKNMQRLQQLAREHISKIQSVCSMADDDVHTMDDNDFDKEIRAKIAKDHSFAVTAVKEVDKPNVHRLYELFETTLPMIGHVSRIGELVLERCHQPLKRAIKRSNYQEPHILAVKTVTENDWLGRLTVLLPAVLARDSKALLGCFRLLAGREAVFNINGQLEPHHVSQVLSTLGPHSCVPAELLSQSQTVLSLRRDCFRDVAWTIKGDLETVGLGGFVSTSERRQALAVIERGYKFQTAGPMMQFGNIVQSTLGNGLPGSSISIGDVIETLCCKPKDFQFHIPFAVQPNSLNTPKQLQVESGPAFRCVFALFRVKSRFGGAKIQAAAYPCQYVPVMAPTGTDGEEVKYRIIRCASIVTIEPFTRKVAVLQDCDNSNCTPPSRRGVNNERCFSPLDGDMFFIFSRKQGFPPRQG